MVIFVIFLTMSAAVSTSAALLGDVNKDGKVLAGDARQILRYSASLSVAEAFDPVLADVDKDGHVFADDARRALRVSALLENAENYEQPTDPQPGPADNGSGVAGFGAGLLGATYKEGANTLISPLSVYTALAMLSAGAGGNSLSQLEKTLGADYPAIRSGVSGYMESLEDSGVLKTSNSIWMRDSDALTVREEFIKDNQDYFGAGVFKEPFDVSTVGKINGWVKEKTDGMIPQIIGEIGPNDMLFLINALAFDSEWAQKFMDFLTRDGEFLNYDGTTQTVPFMHSRENKYINYNGAVGFVKDYKDTRYSFVGLMPEDRDTKIADFVSAVSAGDDLASYVNSAQEAFVNLTFPKFEISYSDSLADELIKLGVGDVFDPAKADLDRMGRYAGADRSLFVSDVLHKTFISVTEDGTRAAAVTAVVVEESAYIEQRLDLVFDRPFVYMIWDNEFDMPLFIGVMEKF